MPVAFSIEVARELSFLNEAVAFQDVLRALVVIEDVDAQLVQVHLVEREADQRPDRVAAETAIPGRRLPDEEAEPGSPRHPVDVMDGCVADVGPIVLPLDREVTLVGGGVHGPVEPLHLVREGDRVARLERADDVRVVHPAVAAFRVFALEGAKDDVLARDHEPAAVLARIRREVAFSAHCARIIKIGVEVAKSPAVLLQGILCDIDGTLVDSNDIHTDCWVEAFAHFGKRVEWDVVRQQIGKGGDLLVPDLCNAREMQKFGEPLNKYRGELFKKKYMKSVKPFPRITDALRTIHDRGIALALASSANQDEVKYYTDLLEIGDLIEASTSKKDAKLSKPSPEIFEAALAQAGTDPRFTLVAGDTPYDILAAHRCALPVAAVLCGGFERQLLTKAEFIVDDVEELVRKIDSIEDYFRNE